MSTKYNRLTEHLANRDDQSWTASFDQIENVIGFPLPESARSYQAWWSNQMRSQSLAWQRAGWKTAALDLGQERVTFVYVGGNDDEAEPGKAPTVVTTPLVLTIAEAKAGLAANFGVEPSQIEITIKA